MTPARIALATILLTFGLAGSRSNAQLPFEREPIAYSKTPARDPVAKLSENIAAGHSLLEHDDHYGYLVSLMKRLDVPAWSQTLVFSKTSLQRHLISPSNPRAVYFNDDTYIAWIPNGELIEIASIDPLLGSVFYTIEQTSEQTSDEPAQKIERRNERCLFCHGSSDTGRVPGLMMRSVYTNSKGYRVFPSRSIHPDPDGPLSSRWAGWFVTGTHGDQRHLGNLMVDSVARVTDENQFANTNIADLSKWFDVSQYLSPHSDIVALLVLQHQVTTHNLLTDANHLARVHLHTAAEESRRKGQPKHILTAEDEIYLDQIAERLVDGLLMVGEPVFAAKISGTSPFAKEFSKRGPDDVHGRSLRQLELNERLFQYRCSYLIYSESFDGLPKPLLAATYRRLLNVLLSQDKRAKYTHLATAERAAILQILRETKTNLPAAWNAEA